MGLITQYATLSSLSCSRLCADTNSLQITGMRVHTDNKASTVLQLFLEAVIRFGFPSRLCGDRGGENLDVAICMIMFRGANRASFMWGS